VAGSALEYATFLGDSGSGFGIAVDGSGTAYVTGQTASSGFPTTVDAFDTTYNGGAGDAFVAKVLMDPTACVYLPLVLRSP
jgi:hypothetical protein